VTSGETRDAPPSLAAHAEETRRDEVDVRLLQQIRDNLKGKTANELKEMWEDRYSGEYSSEGLEAIRLSLVELGVLTVAPKGRISEDNVVGRHILIDTADPEWLELPSVHPLVQSIARFGDPDRIAREIDEEVQPELGTVRIGSVLFTSSWMLLGYESNRLSIFNYGELGWVYERVIQHSVNLVPTYQDHLLVVHALSAAMAEVRMGKAHLDEAARELGERAPWVLIGHNRMRERYWRDRRQQLITEISVHREEILAAMEAQGLKGTCRYPKRLYTGSSAI